MQSVYLVLNDTCNLSCPSCIRNNIKSLKGMLAEEQGQFIIRSVADVLPNVGIVLTGGEPFLNPIWESLFQESITLFGKVCICTNGIISNENILKLNSLLRGNAYVQISIDGDKIGDSIIRGEEHFSKAIELLRCLQPNSQNVIISTTVNRKNKNHIVPLVRILNQYKFAYWKLSWMQNADPINDQDEIPYNEWNHFVDNILNICNFKVHASHQFDFRIWDSAIKSGQFYNIR